VRLTRDGQFKTVLAEGARAAKGPFAVFAAANSCGTARFGVAVGKSCGTAAARNRLKRLAREAFRRNRHRLAAGADYVFLVWPPGKSGFEPKKVTYRQVEDFFVAGAQKAAGRLPGRFGRDCD
jgi:ribonuclease P protein component